MNRTYSLSIAVLDALEKRARELGEPMSRLVEQGLRHVLALPLEVKTEAPKPPGGGFEATRTEEALLFELKRAGPGFHTTWDLRDRVGCSTNVAEKGLLALARRGEIIRWGDWHRQSDGQKGVSTWGMKAPVELARASVDAWRAAGGVREDKRARDLLVAWRKLAEGIDSASLVQIRPIIRELIDFDDHELRLWNLEELQREKDRQNAEEAAEWEAEQAKEREALKARQAREREAAERMDRAPRVQAPIVESDWDGS